MDKSDKQLLGTVAIFLIICVLLTAGIIKEINDAGGIKQIIIDAGKDIKDISKEINKD